MITSSHDGKWVVGAVFGDVDRMTPKRHERKQTTCTDQVYEAVADITH